MSTTDLQDWNTVLEAVEDAQTLFTENHPKEGQTQLTKIKKTAQARIQILNPPTPPTPVVPMPVGIAGNWTMKFDQEFDQMTELDTDFWAPGWWPNAEGLSDPVNTLEAAAYNAANISFTSEGLNGLFSKTPITAPGTGKQYEYTAMLISSNPGGGAKTGFQFTYGVAEARIYLPGTGTVLDNWPAFWQTTAPQYPYNETDTLEVLDTKCWAHIHNTNGPANNVGLEATTPITAGWHTFANEWDATGVTFYYDGQSIGKAAATGSNQPQYLIFGNSASLTPPPVAPVTTICQYIRVWQAA